MDDTDIQSSSIVCVNQFDNIELNNWEKNDILLLRRNSIGINDNERKENQRMSMF